MRFGLYLIPDDGPLYQTGSSVVGYDVRNQRKVSLPAFINPIWAESNSQFGFHVTITDAITIASNQLGQIIAETENILKCFKPSNRYILTKERVGFWRSESNMAALLMKPDRNIEMLHDVLVARLHPLGAGSEYFDKYNQDETWFIPNSPVSVRKTKQFFSPYIFDEFAPHFTCINSYNGPPSERVIIEENLARLFENIDVVEFDKIALVVQAFGESYFRIVKEFSLKSM